jgi:hypothetical protein
LDKNLLTILVKEENSTRLSEKPLIGVDHASSVLYHNSLPKSEDARWSAESILRLARRLPLTVGASAELTPFSLAENSETMTQPLELRASKRFGEYVSNLVVGAAILQEYVTTGVCLLHKEVSDVNMFGASMTLGVFDKFDGRLVVLMNRNRAQMWEAQLLEQVT